MTNQYFKNMMKNDKRILYFDNTNYNNYNQINYTQILIYDNIN